MSERILETSGAARAGATEADAAEVLARDAAADVRAFYLQAAFRALLDAMARPGELAELPQPDEALGAEAARFGMDVASLMLADVLLDAATSFAVAGSRAEALERAIAGRTHAAVKPVDEAAFVLVGADGRGEVAERAVASATAGTLVSPHLGATVIVACGTLLGLDAAGTRTGSASGAVETEGFELSGPGVDGATRLELDRGDVVRARIERADEFPCGIDLVFVDGAGHVAAIPRSTKITSGASEANRSVLTVSSVEEGGASWDM